MRELVRRHVSAAFVGAFVALTVLAVVGLFALGVVWAIDGAATASAKPDPLRDWSTARILAELGEAAQVAACDPIIGQPGLTARFYVREGQRDLIVVCSPS